MNRLFKLTTFVSVTGVVLFISCTKEPPEPPHTTASGLANAGSNQTINLPADSVTLDGSRSTEPDNNIKNYSRGKMSAPNEIVLSTGSSAYTKVTGIGCTPILEV